MDKDKKILEYADYYLNNEGSMESAAENFGVSKKTFQLYMKELSQISSEKYRLVQEKKTRNLTVGAKKGGQSGKPYTHIQRPIGSISHKHTLTEEESKSLARDMIDEDLTFRDAGKKYNIPKSTISDNLTRENLGDELYGEFSSFIETHKSRTRQK